jgi:predicted Zn-dependent protease
MQVLFYDGQTARPRHVVLALAEDAIEIAEGETVLARWPYDEVRRQESASSPILRLSLADPASLARLELTDPDAQAQVLARCTALTKGHHEGRAGTIVAWSLAATASLIASVLFLVPMVADYAAPLVPVSWERRLGTAVDNRMRLLLGDKTCTHPAGGAALDRLVARLAETAPQRVQFDVRVLDLGVKNAVALPGGRIYLYRGLLEEAESADEIAGVLAHEIGHVAHRDNLRALIQTGGTSFLLGLLFGDVAARGTLVRLGRMAVDAAYSRPVESAADRFAADTMLALGRSPRAVGVLLERIAPDGGPIPPVLSSHPLTKERLDALPQPKEPLGEPLMSDEEWRALRSICKVG